MHTLSLMISLLMLTAVPAVAQPLVNLTLLRLQVTMDRAGFSPGAIDGRMGANTRKALGVYRKQGNWDQPAEPVIRYRITPEDAAGPYVSIPAGMKRKGSLLALGYSSLLEAVAERFHTTPMFLRQLNPAARFREGEEITVPNVAAMVMHGGPSKHTVPIFSAPPVSKADTVWEPLPEKPDIVVTVRKSTSLLTVTNATGHVVFSAPVSTGSKRDPLPLGRWKVNGVQFNPVYHYNPHLFWNAGVGDVNVKIPAGANNPVGLVWIDISKKHYGLHGTPEPALIGRTQSHGCVRLTNWDALRLAALVKPGTPVLFIR